MKIRIEIDENKLKELVYEYLEEMMGTVPFRLEDVDIEVKSKQNYKAEWESASFRAVVSKHTI